MGKLTLSGKHKKKLEELIEEGIKAKEIQKIFKEKYGFDMPSWKISYERSKVSSPKKEKKNGHTPDTVVEDIGNEILNLIKEIPGTYKEILLGIRLELIKARNEAFKIKAGLPKED